MKEQYYDLKTALADKEGVAVLGFFYEVSTRILYRHIQTAVT